MVRIIIIRHAEKYSAEFGYFLANEGELRSKRIIGYIKDKFGVPDIIFARSPVFPNYSFRSIETIYPLAKSLKRPIRIVPSVAELINSINKYFSTDYLILICWEHDEVPSILQELGWTILSWSKDPFKYPTDDNNYSLVIEVLPNIIKFYDQDDNNYFMEVNKWNLAMNT